MDRGRLTRAGRFLASLFLFLYVSAVLGFGAPSSTPNILHCEHYSIDDGLSSNLVYRVQQDRHGLIWLSTNAGLSRYDGYDFLIFQHDPGNPKSLSSDDISCIVEDSPNFFWIGTYKGLHSLDVKNNVITRYGHIPADLHGQRKYRITFLLQDDEGQIWIGTRGGGLGRLDKKRNDFIWFQNQSGNEATLRSNKLYAAIKDSSGKFLISAEGGHLERFDPKSGVIEHLLDRYQSKDVQHPDIMKIWEDSQGIIWFGAWDGGLMRLDIHNNTLKHWMHDPADPESLSNNIIQSLYQDKTGIFWIGTRGGGIDLFDPSTEKFHHAALSDEGIIPEEKNVVLDIIQDSMGGFWFATLDQGLYHYDPNAAWFDLYRRDPMLPTSLSSNKIYAFCEDQDGNIWVGTDGGGLNRFDSKTKTFTIYRNIPNQANSLLTDSIISLLTDRKGVLWIGYWMDGFSRFDPKTETFQHFQENPNGLHGKSIRALCEDSQGRIWIGTEGAGVTVYDPETGVFTYHPYDGKNAKALSDQFIRCIFRDRKNTIWVGTGGFGLNRYNPMTNDFTVFQSASILINGLSGNTINAINEDAQGRLWIATESGLNRMDPNPKDPDHPSFTNYTIRNGLPSNLIKSIETDESGNLWISTERGLSRFTIRNETFQNFDTRDRLQGLSFISGSSYKAKSGELYFGGLDGFNVFHPQSIPRNNAKPPILISSFTVMGKSIDWEEILRKEKSIRLPYDRNFLQIEFTALNYTRSYRNQYAYQLIGLEENWTNSTKRRYVQYTSLQPGNYEFRVIGSNNDGIWNKQGISIPITITPPYWETTWFRVIISGLLVTIFIIAYESRVRSIHRRRMELQKEVERQTRKVVEQSLELERVNQELEKLSFLDGLTNIPNRRRFEDHFAREWKRASRSQEWVSLIMIDIDWFKKYNDTYGHQAGDECLRLVANTIQNNAKRPSDLAARYGGEEFIILLPGANAANSYSLAEIIRRNVENLKIPHAQSDLSDYVTLSLGGATLIPSPEIAPDHLIRLADESLYRAKKEGRNQTHWADLQGGEKTT